MPNTTEADDILQHARPVVNQRGHETQPFGHLARLPIALDEAASRNSVEHLNQLLATRSPYGTCTRSVIGRWRDTRSISSTCCSTNTRRNKPSSSSTSRNAFICLAASASRWRTTSPSGPYSATTKGTRGRTRPDIAPSVRTSDRTEGSADDGTPRIPGR